MKKNQFKFRFIVCLCMFFFSLSVTAQKEIPTEEEFFNIIRTQGITKAVDLFQTVRKNHPGVSIFGEYPLNNLGHEFFSAGKIEEALGIFKLNMETYPDAWNTYDSYAEASMVHGDIELAIENFRKSVELNLPEALVFETGSNQWKSYNQWPPAEAVEKDLYFHADGRLSFFSPAEESDEAFDSYISDPDKPVPWSTNIQTRQGHLWMIEDQRFAAKRPDVLVYQSDILNENVTIAGPIIADIYVSTTGTDADWIVKLIDVYPGDELGKMGDYQMLLAGEVFRSKYRNSFENSEPLVPNKVTKIKFDLRDKCHTFLKGHRIMVQVQSTWFPVIDRNTQKYVDIYHAKEEDFQKAVHTIYRSKEFPSHLKIKVMELHSIGR